MSPDSNYSTGVWVIQEFILAKELIFQHGDSAFDFQFSVDFTTKASAHIQALIPKGTLKMIPTQEVDRLRKNVGFLTSARAFFHLNEGRLAWPQNWLLTSGTYGSLDDDQGPWIQRSEMILKLNNLIFEARRRQATDLRDRVYGLLAIFNTALGLRMLKADYSKSLELVCREFAQAFVERSQSLALLMQSSPTTNNLRGFTVLDTGLHKSV
jgi:hypothetical protein